MNACRREADVLRAVRDDQWTDALRRHLTECSDCVAAVSVAPWMTQFARFDDRPHKLPDPSIVWLKAKLLAGTRDMSRASRPLTMIQLVAYLVVAGGWAAVLMWKWDAVESWFRGISPASMVTATTKLQSLSVSFMVVLVALATMTVMVALHTILAEET